jgi:hypothetical protein
LSSVSVITFTIICYHFVEYNRLRLSKCDVLS